MFDRAPNVSASGDGHGCNSGAPGGSNSIFFIFGSLDGTINNFIKNDVNKHKETLARYQDRPPHDVREPEFDDILYKVTP